MLLGPPPLADAAGRAPSRAKAAMPGQLSLAKTSAVSSVPCSRKEPGLADLSATHKRNVECFLSHLILLSPSLDSQHQGLQDLLVARSAAQRPRGTAQNSKAQAVIPRARMPRNRPSSSCQSQSRRRGRHLHQAASAVAQPSRWTRSQCSSTGPPNRINMLYVVSLRVSRFLDPAGTVVNSVPSRHMSV